MFRRDQQQQQLVQYVGQGMQQVYDGLAENVNQAAGALAGNQQEMMAEMQEIAGEVVGGQQRLYQGQGILHDGQRQLAQGMMRVHSDLTEQNQAMAKQLQRLDDHGQALVGYAQLALQQQAHQYAVENARAQNEQRRGDAQATLNVFAMTVAAVDAQRLALVEDAEAAESKQKEFR